MSSLWELTDEKLLEAYSLATRLHLDSTFIVMLEDEMKTRGLNK